MNQRSTNNIGGDCNEKTSVRVHHAPGGQSSFTFAHQGAPEKPVTNVRVLNTQ